MNETTFYYRDYLKRELAERCERNSRYSIRAFARALETDVAALSRILTGKQIPSYKLAQKIVEKLGLDPEECVQFFSSVAEVQRSRNLQRLSPLFRRLPIIEKTEDLSIDVYRIIADWHHFAILELSLVEDMNLKTVNAPKAIARELGISEAEAALAVDRLLKLGLLEEHDGKLLKTNEQLSSIDKHISTPALRKNQKQFLEKAIHSLENDPIEDRSMSSMTMAIDPEKLPIAKQMIREFNQTLCKFLETGSRKRVYNLEVALYPLQAKPAGKQRSKSLRERRK